MNVEYIILLIQDFIKRCLAYSQNDRIDVYEANEHPFINNKKKIK
jgi:hypothetical protein